MMVSSDHHHEASHSIRFPSLPASSPFRIGSLSAQREWPGYQWKLGPNHGGYQHFTAMSNAASKTNSLRPISHSFSEPDVDLTRTTITLSTSATSRFDGLMSHQWRRGSCKYLTLDKLNLLRYDLCSLPGALEMSGQLIRVS